MPLYMDMHKGTPGTMVDPESIADAHQKDLQTQSKYGVNYQKYFLDKDSGTLFCLVEAPSKEAAIRVHRESHGMTANEIWEVSEHT